MPPFIKGISNVRGTVVPIIDLHLMLRLPQVEQQASLFTVVLRHQEFQVGLLVDAVPEILTARPDQYVRSPEHEGVRSGGIIAGRLQLDEDLNYLLDVKGLLAYLESEAVDADLEKGTTLLGN